jgi:ribosomal protein S18 acetylase RimI-like enzyme
MNSAISLRPVTEADEPFLYGLYKSVRGPEFAQVPLPPEQLEMLFSMQYRARTGSYEATFPKSQNSVILSGDTPIGQIWVDRNGGQILLVDIALLPAYRGTGIGSALVEELIAEARQSGLPLICSVATNNPGSLRFHQRLGFAIVAEDPMYYELEYRVAG